MGRYDDLRQVPLISTLTILGRAEIDALARRYPGVPPDYCDFLLELGWGTVGTCLFAFYGGLVEPCDIFGEGTEYGPKEVVLFGDDFSGNPYGFLPEGEWRVVEIDHETRSMRVVADTFEGFLRGALKEWAGT